jgi:hypothetical protein
MWDYIHNPTYIVDVVELYMISLKLFKEINNILRYEIMNILIETKEEHDDLLNFLYNKSNSDEEKQFRNDFHCIFFNSSQYVVDSQTVRKWIIYSDNFCFKRFFSNFLKENDDYSVYKKKKLEGYIFTLKAFQKMLIKYDNELKLHAYITELEKDIKDYYVIYKDKLHALEKQQLILENEKLVDNRKSIIYIYNTDTRNKTKTPILKIGLTENIQERIKAYTTSHPHGTLVYQEEVLKSCLKLAEKVLHQVLIESGFLVKSECFEISIDEAILWVKNVNNLFKLSKKNDRYNKLAEIVSKASYVIDNVVCEKKVLHYDISTQTDAVVEEVQTYTEDEIQHLRILKEPPTNIGSFNRFIEECCIIDKEKDVSSVDIIGRYRIWSQNADKESYHSLLDYLKDVFKPIRLQLQNKQNVVNGFQGICLKAEEPFTLPLAPSKYDMFVYNNCSIIPSGKVLFADIKKVYIEWRMKLNDNADVPDSEIKELKEYLNNFKKILKANVWTHTGNGSGYYGIILNQDIPYKTSMTSSTSKTVEKINIATNEIMNTWSTIAKAAASENISAARMSRICKSKEVINDSYFFRVK